MSHAEFLPPKNWTTLGDRQLRRRSMESSSPDLRNRCIRSRYVWAKQRREPGQFDSNVPSLGSISAPLAPQNWGELESKSPSIGGFRGLTGWTSVVYPSKNGCNSKARRSQSQRLKVHFAIYCTAKSLHLPRHPLPVPTSPTGDRDRSPQPTNLAQFRSTRRSSASSSDNLRQTLIDYFQGQAATFDFWAQLQAKLLPLTAEDPTLGWQDQSPSDYPVTVIELAPAQWR